MRLFFTFLLALGFFNAFAQRNCATMDELAAQLQQNPALQQQLQQIEEHNHHYHEQLPNLVGFREVVTIPVVFHIIHNGDPVGSNENLAESYILAQLAQLNDDMRKLNTDQSLIPSIFQNLHADTEIQFCLAQRRPDGTATNGINRVQYAQASWTTAQVNSTIKPATIWDRNQYLNVWTVVFGGSSSGILGYAQFPGGNSTTDGVVVASNTVGSLTLPNPGSSNYGKGRTLTHEVGHWLNLRHIWGDATCGNDFVDDTPVHNTSNAGCPVYPHLSTCSGNPVEMTMNYMDYTFDACMQMFTFGQKTRMQAVLSPGGARFSLLSSLGCVPPSTSCTAPTVAQINASNISSTAAQLNCTVSGVNAYDWRYRVSGTSTWIDLPVTTANLSNLIGLTPSTTYEFQTMVQCGTLWSSWSSSKTFTTLAAPCNAPAITQISASNIGINSARLNCSVTGVNSYDWRYRVSGTTTWTDLTATTNNFADINGLSASTAYEFQVSVQCGTVWSNWSSSQTFNTLAQPCNAPAIAQVSASNIGINSARLNCSVTGVNGYDWRYRVSGATTWTDLAATTNNFIDISGLSASTVYEFQVSVQCGTVWSSWSSSQTFTTLAQTCNAPLITQISPSNIGINSARLNCSVSGVTGYDWRYRVSGTTTWTDLSATAVNFSDLSGLSAATTYEFQSSVQCGSIWSSWSPTQTFTTLAQPCNAPTLAQISVSNLGSSSVRLNCTVTGVSAYDWRYRLSGTASWIDLSSTSTPFIDIDGLNPVSAYEFQVSVQCGTNWTGWSPTASFTTLQGGNCDTPFSWLMNFTNITYNSARFNYTDVSFQGYRWRYRVSGTSTWITSSTQTNPYLDVTGLASGTQYMVEVSVQCANGTWSGWSTFLRFSTPPQPCAGPADNEISASNITFNSAQLNCAITGVSAYDWRYRLVGNSTWIELADGTAPFYPLNALSAATTYEFQVSVLCAAGWSAWSNSKTFTTSSPLCDPPSAGELAATLITDTNARLNCAITFASSYYWRYRPVGSGFWTNTPATSVNYTDVSNLQPATLYEFQVRIQCPNNLTDWSASGNFTTLNPCLAPSLQTLAVNNITQSSALLNCNANSSGNYFWRYRQLNAPNWINLGTTAIGMYSLSGLFPSTTYEFQVATQCGPGSGPWSVSSIFTTTAANCNQPGGQSFTATNITAFTARFESYLGGLTQYDWRYRPEGTILWIDLPESASVISDITGLEPGTTYEFQSAVQCGGTWSPWSFSRTFTTLPNPCVAPTSGEIFITQITPTSVRLNTSIQNASAYYWRYRQTASPSWITLPSGTVNYYDLTNLNPGTGYEFQSAVSCGSTTSSWSPNKRFLTPLVTREEPHSGLQFRIWPVPAREEVFVSFRSPDGAAALLTLLDTAGKVIRSTSIGSVEPGVQSYALNLHDLPAGMYILQLRSGKITETEKLVIFAE